MVEPLPSGNMGTPSDRGDISQSNLYNISQGGSEGANAPVGDRVRLTVEVDREVVDLVSWLAQQQAIGPELALKKAVATAAYIYDITQTQGGKLLVRRKDNTVGEIVFK